MNIFHVLGVSTTETNDEYAGCPFTTGAKNLISEIVKDGDTVIHYCNPGSDTAGEDVFVTGKRVLDIFGESHASQYHASYQPKAIARLCRDFSIACAAEVRKRVQPGDFVLLPSDGVQDVIAMLGDVPDIKIVEINVGYPDPLAMYRIFETNTWRSFWRGRADRTLRIYETLSHNHGHQNSHGHGHLNMSDVPRPMFYNKNIMVPTTEPRWVLDTAIFPIVCGDMLKSVDEGVSREDYFLFLGRIIKGKGIFEAIELTERLGRRLIIAGPGRFEDELEPLVGNLPPHVEFFGMAKKTDRDLLLSKAACVVALSRYNEPFGYVVPESSRFGTPVLTSDTGGFSESVCEGVNGFTGGCMADWVEKSFQLETLDSEKIFGYYKDNFSSSVLYPKYKQFWRRINAFVLSGMKENFVYSDIE